MNKENRKTILVAAIISFSLIIVIIFLIRNKTADSLDELLETKWQRYTLSGLSLESPKKFRPYDVTVPDGMKSQFRDALSSNQLRLENYRIDIGDFIFIVSKTIFTAEIKSEPRKVCESIVLVNLSNKDIRDFKYKISPIKIKEREGMVLDASYYVIDKNTVRPPKHYSSRNFIIVNGYDLWNIMSIYPSTQSSGATATDRIISSVQIN